MIRPDASALSQLRMMSNKTAKMGPAGLLFAPATVSYIGVGALKGLGRIARDGTVLTNPFYFSNRHSGYGKRGLDPEEVGSDGLVQGMHNKRRKR